MGELPSKQEMFDTELRCTLRGRLVNIMRRHGAPSHVLPQHTLNAIASCLVDSAEQRHVTAAAARHGGAP